MATKEFAVEAKNLIGNDHYEAMEQFFLWYYINYVLPLKDDTGEAIETNPICC